MRKNYLACLLGFWLFFKKLTICSIGCSIEGVELFFPKTKKAKTKTKKLSGPINLKKIYVLSISYILLLRYVLRIRYKKIKDILK